MAELQYFTGTMDSGKSTLALQTNHNHAARGRVGRIFTSHDRAGAATLSSRLGLQHEAIEVPPDFDFWKYVVHSLTHGARIDYLICDEAQFYSPQQVEQLARLVDEMGVDVFAFGITTDFRTRLFEGTARLFELADDVQRVQVEVLCWCGFPGLLNARVVDGVMVREGATVVVADTGPAGVPGEDAGSSPAVRYQVLCRRHYVRGELGPTPAGPGQLALP